MTNDKPKKNMEEKIREFKYERNGASYLIYAGNTVFFCQNNRLHRSNGPAIMCNDGSASCYYLAGERQTKEEHGKRRKALQI